MLCAGEFSALADQFGYALAFGREPAVAIHEDLLASLSDLGASSLDDTAGSVPSVRYFAANDARLIAVIEQTLPADNAREVLLELVVIGDGAEQFLSLEQISAVR